MTARILLTERDKMVNEVVAELWKDLYNHERFIIDMIYNDVITWSDKYLREKHQSLSETAIKEVGA